MNHRVRVPFVSACPGWVGTHILRSKIEHESWRERLFYAFAYDVDGYGLSSILKAMFVPLLDVHVHFENYNNNQNYDYYENEDYFPNIGGFLAWSGYAADRVLVVIESTSTALLGTNNNNTNNTGIVKYIRYVLCAVCIPIVLGLQRFFTTTDVINHGQNPNTIPSFFTYKSSMASYDRTLQRDLYEWSLEAIVDFL